jgi:hypothetical protein
LNRAIEREIGVLYSLVLSNRDIKEGLCSVVALLCLCFMSDISDI